MQTTNHNYCIILAGGNGSRFWPLSRDEKPKQFIDFFGTGRTLLQQSFDRMSKIIPEEHIFVTTNRIYKDLVTDQLPELKAGNILIEPAPRNTAVCVAWASSNIKAIDTEASIIISPCDQLIVREDEFFKAVTTGLNYVASTGNILTLGIKPNRPETAFGYIQASEETNDDGTIMRAKSFSEKPEPEFAKIFFESGEFYWNTGLLLWNVKTIIHAFKRLLPDVASELEANDNTPDFEKRVIEANYTTCPCLPIDTGILEKADNVFIMPCDFGWVDLGTWQSYYEALPKDSKNNAKTQSKVIMHNSEGNIVSLPDEHVAIVSGLKDFLVVEHKNVLLVCPREESSNMRRFISESQVKFGEDTI